MWRLRNVKSTELESNRVAAAWLHQQQQHRRNTYFLTAACTFIFWYKWNFVSSSGCRLNVARMRVCGIWRAFSIKMPTSIYHIANRLFATVIYWLNSLRFFRVVMYNSMCESCGTTVMCTRSTCDAFQGFKFQNIFCCTTFSLQIYIFNVWYSFHVVRLESCTRDQIEMMKNNFRLRSHWMFVIWMCGSQMRECSRSVQTWVSSLKKSFVIWLHISNWIAGNN